MSLANCINRFVIKTCCISVVAHGMVSRSDNSNRIMKNTIHSDNNNDRLLYSPAFERNRDPILAVLQEKVLPNIVGKTVLEVGSGTGQHAIYFTSHISSSGINNDIVWIPSEPYKIDPIKDWIDVTDDRSLIGNMCQPVILDVCSNKWSCVEDVETFNKLQTLDRKSVPAVSCIVTINMIHIAPWSATVGLLAGAKRILPSGGILYLYGPFKRHNQHTAPSNESFDNSLQQRNPDWGVRNLETIIDSAGPEFKVRDIIDMPSNNLSVILEKL